MDFGPARPLPEAVTRARLADIAAGARGRADDTRREGRDGGLDPGGGVRDRDALLRARSAAAMSNADDLPTDLHALARYVADRISANNYDEAFRATLVLAARLQP